MASREFRVKESVKNLKSKIRLERNSDTRDRIRIFVLVAKCYTNVEIAKRLGYSLPWVQKWISRYKQGGLSALHDGKRTGQPALLTDEQVLILYDEILAGPDPDGPLSRYRIVDIQALIKSRFGVDFSLSGTHALMQRMKLSHVKPRPSHPKNDPQAMEDWKKKRPMSLRSKKTSIPVKLSKSGSKMKRDLARKEL